MNGSATCVNEGEPDSLLCRVLVLPFDAIDNKDFINMELELPAIEMTDNDMSAVCPVNMAPGGEI